MNRMSRSDEDGAAIYFYQYSCGIQVWTVALTSCEERV